MKGTGPINPTTKELVIALRKLSNKEKVKIWKDIAKRLQKPRRQRPSVNVSKLERYCKKNENVIVPGKLLSDGKITKALTIGALSCSGKASEKIQKAGGKCLSIQKFIKINPKGKKTRIMG
jgi:large subunit ribosomal protein L18e